MQQCPFHGSNVDESFDLFEKDTEKSMKILMSQLRTENENRTFLLIIFFFFFKVNGSSQAMSKMRTFANGMNGKWTNINISNIKLNKIKSELCEHSALVYYSYIINKIQLILRMKTLSNKRVKTQNEYFVVRINFD